MKRVFRRNVLAAAVFGAVALSGTALAVDEVEPNHPIQSAQRLIIPPNSSVTVYGVVGTNDPTKPAIQDADFYSFSANENDVITIDIDGGWKGPTPPPGTRNVDTWIALFGPGPDYVRKTKNEDAPFAPTYDDGSISNKDSIIEKYKVGEGEGGIWTVGVVGYRNTLVDGGRYGTGSAVAASTGNGSYTLIITVARLTQQIKIDIKPGSDGLAPANPKAKGTIPVALLSSPEFNALDVSRDLQSLTFGRTGSEKSLRRCGWDGEDVNGDGRLDLVCHFDNQLADFADDVDIGKLRGVTKDGVAFEGNGDLKVVPVKHEE
jgi:hypothetical protein